MTTLADLYAQIPKMQCVAGCTDCCGPVPMHPEEVRRFGPVRLVEFRGAAMADCSACPHSIAGSCAIYENRPFLCRLFGTVPDEPMMRCPRGCVPEKPLTRAQSDRLTKQYLNLIDEASK